jgi:hypothetical protein
VVRRMRHGMTQIATSRRGVAHKSARALPPLSAFGQAPVRSASPVVAR